jgi:hypothetical protein
MVAVFFQVIPPSHGGLTATFGLPPENGKFLYHTFEGQSIQ